MDRKVQVFQCVQDDRKKECCTQYTNEDVSLRWAVEYS